MLFSLPFLLFAESCRISLPKQKDKKPPDKKFIELTRSKADQTLLLKAANEFSFVDHALNGALNLKSEVLIFWPAQSGLVFIGFFAGPAQRLENSERAEFYRIYLNV